MSYSSRPGSSAGQYPSAHAAGFSNLEDNAAFLLNRIEAGANPGWLGDPSAQDPAPQISKSEEQLVLEAAFSAVCDNIMAN